MQSLVAILICFSDPGTICAQESDPVARLYLVDVRSGKDLHEVTEDGVLNLDALHGKSVTIRADVRATPREVIFDWNSTRRYRAETAAPYSLAGDVGGKYHAWVPKLGENTIVIRINGADKPVLKRVFQVVRGVGRDQMAFIAKTEDDSSVKASLRADVVLPNEPDLEQPEIRINCGGGEFIDREGRQWSADDSFGEGGSYGLKISSDDFAGTAVFRNGRDSRGGPLRYAIPVQPGGYEVVFHFMELYAAGGGRRIFDVIAEGNPLVNDLDISERVGVGAPLSLTRFVSVADGIMNLEFPAKIGLASVAGIEILPRTKLEGEAQSR